MGFDPQTRESKKFHMAEFANNKCPYNKWDGARQERFIDRLLYTIETTSRAWIACVIEIDGLTHIWKSSRPIIHWTMILFALITSARGGALRPSLFGLGSQIIPIRCCTFSTGEMPHKAALRLRLRKRSLTPTIFCSQSRGAKLM